VNVAKKFLLFMCLATAGGGALHVRQNLRTHSKLVKNAQVVEAKNANAESHNPVSTWQDRGSQGGAANVQQSLSPQST
jgi:hypothetical protein